MTGAPDVRRNRSGRSRGQQDSVLVLAHVTSGNLQIIRMRFTVDQRSDQRQPPQAAIELFDACTKWPSLIAQHQPDLRAFVDEMLEQRRRLDHTTLKTFLHL